MVTFSQKFKNGIVFIDCSQNLEEKLQLENLLRQVESICRMVGREGKTGLHIVGSFSLNENLVAIFSLNSLVELVDDELDLIKKEIDCKLK